MDNLNPYVPERVYDRSVPTRIGTVFSYNLDSHTAQVKWRDKDEPTWHDIDALGAVPDDYDESETEEAYLTRKGRMIRPLR